MAEIVPLDGQPMVQAEGVGLTRADGQGREAVILSGVTFSAAKGRITAIVGPSGGGKSSLIRLINRLDDPTTGRILLGGEDIAGMDPLLLRRRVAMVLQRPFMFPGTLLHNLQRPLAYRREPVPDADSVEVRRTLELARLAPDLLERDARSLSIGQQQRASLARAVITSPRVLLLDEPTSALDRPTGDQLATALQDICRHQGMAAILVTHDLRLAGKVADDLIYLEAGRIREAGPAAQVLAKPASAELIRFLAEPVREGEHG
ncbi:ATP-binding cassette domain-containing protein [Oryzomonas sagensis]|uniref:ATP-binding cassette domain-containing protein n=1 Tax=Oryzomonas sagensis TaxID=2603857 RepID=A0ABQ6TLF7_9BACT|nr:ATP-binding cassette domain-containing protein [Oryzomonas sagensis]KAB0669107.1 ATP-binding cassette domain-containing protein [Oryzomonas sagensis]